MRSVDCVVVSSLQKVFMDETPVPSAFRGKESILRGETYAFQIAVRKAEGDRKPLLLTPSPRGETAPFVTVRAVRSMPANLCSYLEKDGDYLRDGNPGLYPDLLEPVSERNPLRVEKTLWQCVWVEYTPDDHTAAGIKRIEIVFTDETGAEIVREETTVRLIDAALAGQDLVCTQWLHCDCLADWYGDEPLSEAHFIRLEQYVRTAVKNGINMLLTPVFTPPLDTAPGGERPTVQLVGVTEKNGDYSFDFTLFRRFVKMALECGITFIEISHLFTQWGAAHAPKIMAEKDGLYRRIFGWETDASGAEYTAFLCAFLPRLTAEIKSLGIADRTYFHISDEPSLSHASAYRAARDVIKPHIEGFKTFDALSNYEFYEQGLVETPVCAVNHIDPFLKNRVHEKAKHGLWAYYCCSQCTGVSNRFFAMPSYRNRILAAQLFKYDIRGFLHWGYNFWYLQYSAGKINPFITTDAGLAFPAGDAFSVYPGTDGPLESIRLRVFSQALCDLRAMRMLEKLRGRDAVMRILEDGIEPIEFDSYPRGEEYLLSLRARINEEIAKAL